MKERRDAFWSPLASTTFSSTSLLLSSSASELTS